jgi:hypothetical protein
MPSALPPTRPALTQPLRDLAAWTAHFRAAEIPVLAHTSEALEALRINEDEVDANSIGEMISGDPLMTLKVLAYSSAHRGSRVVTDTETVTAALVMMGISPFFGSFGLQPTVQDRLQGEPEALAGLNQTLQRAHRSANFALGFAVHRMDHDSAVIHAAALLHDFAEMLLWCHAERAQRGAGGAAGAPHRERLGQPRPARRRERHRPAAEPVAGRHAAVRAGDLRRRKLWRATAPPGRRRSG